MKKKTVIIASIIYLFVTAVYLVTVFFYINKTILPKKIKPLLAQIIQNNTGKPTTIETISFSLSKGITLGNLIVSEAINRQPLEFSRVHIKINYIPLLLKKKLIYDISTSPARNLMFSIKTEGNIQLKNKALETKIKMTDFPLAIINGLIKRRAINIADGKSNVEAEISIDGLKNLKADARLPFKDLSVNLLNNSAFGEGTIELNITKNAGSEEADYAGTFIIKKMEANLAEPLNKKIAINGGNIQFNKERIEISTLAVGYLDAVYNVSGTIKDFKRPNAVFKISGTGLEASADLAYSQNEVSVNKSSIKLPYSNLEMQGNIKDLRNPEFDIYLTGNLNTKDLGLLPFKFASIIKKLGLDSQVETELYLNGNVKQWQNFTGLLKLKAENATLKNIGLQNLRLTLEASEGKASLKTQASAYGGKLEVFIDEADLKEKIHFNSRIIIEDVDLKKLNADYLKTGKELSGYFNAESNINGNLLDIKNIAGAGWFEITEGRLWELPLFKGLLGIIAVSGTEKNVFREAHCDFIIKDRAVSTQNFELISQRMTIAARGSVYFDGKLNLRAKTSLAGQKETTTVDRLQDVLVKGAGSLVKEVLISGTLKKPEYKIIPASIDSLLENILK